MPGPDNPAAASRMGVRLEGITDLQGSGRRF